MGKERIKAKDYVQGPAKRMKSMNTKSRGYGTRNPLTRPSSHQRGSSPLPISLSFLCNKNMSWVLVAV